jgi:hypothetical protein
MSPRKGDRSSQLKIGLLALTSALGGFTRSTAYRWPVVCAIYTSPLSPMRSGPIRHDRTSGRRFVS